MPRSTFTIVIAYPNGVTYNDVAPTKSVTKFLKHITIALSGITCSLTVSLRDIPRQGGPRLDSLGLSPLFITNIKKELKLNKK